MSAQELRPAKFAGQTLAADALALAKEEASLLPNLLAYVVMHKGFIVDEHYSQPRTAETKNHIRSITKSITSALVGIAVDKGYIESPDTPIRALLPRNQAPISTMTHLLPISSLSF